MNTTLIPDVTLTFSPECCKEYTGMAFDGNYFFLTVPQNLKSVNSAWILYSAASLIPAGPILPSAMIIRRIVSGHGTKTPQRHYLNLTGK